MGFVPPGGDAPAITTTPSPVNDDGIPTWDGPDGDKLKDSGALVEDGIPGGTILELDTYVDADPVGPRENSIWILNDLAGSGKVFIKSFIEGVVRESEMIV